MSREPVIGSLRPGKTQTSLLGYRDNVDFATIYTMLYYLVCENKGTDQTARMRKLICSLLVRTDFFQERKEFVEFVI